MEYVNKVLPVSELKLGDIVDTAYPLRQPYCTAIVKQVTKDYVTLFRPYGTNQNFSYTGGVICLIGLEEYNINRETEAEGYYVFARQDLK